MNWKALFWSSQELADVTELNKVVKALQNTISAQDELLEEKGKMIDLQRRKIRLLERDLEAVKRRSGDARA